MFARENVHPGVTVPLRLHVRHPRPRRLLGAHDAHGGRSVRVNAGAPSGEALRWGGEKLYLRVGAGADVDGREWVRSTRNGPSRTGRETPAAPCTPAGVERAASALPAADTGAGATATVSADTKPVQRKRADRLSFKAALMALNITSNTLWEDAAPKVTAIIAGARRAEDDDLAATWSAAKELLKRKLLHRCTCGVVIGHKSQACLMCSRKGRTWQRRDYRSYKPETAAMVAWVRSREVFFFDELSYVARQLSPNASRAEINKRVHGVVKGFRKRGEVTGGGLKHDRRYEVVKRSESGARSDPERSL
jgi:hypothetical protein